MRELFDSHDILSPSLDMYRDNVDSMKSEILRAFLYQFYAIAQDVVLSEKLTKYALNATTHFLLEISEDILKHVTPIPNFGTIN